MIYTLPPLPYDPAALEPHIDAATMSLHHDKHHQTYVTKLNDALAKHPEIADKDLVELLENLNNVPEDIRPAVRNHGGGHWNHTFFWESLSPEKTEPSAELVTALQTFFGGMSQFQEQFAAAATAVFGSGWTWLVKESETLKIVSTANQDTPLAQRQQPLLGIDVWEHAYYLKYQNRRPEYITAWWNVVNWSKVSERLV